MRPRLPFVFVFAALPVFGSLADDTGDLDYPVIEYVVAQETNDGWRFDVTVRHNDEGWDHYADAWQVVDPDSREVIGERILLHPHDNEQPFTRNHVVPIPAGTTLVMVRARCTVHGFGPEIAVDLAGDGELFEVRRME